MTTTPEDRRVITFYSYKGGVGRTMALANVAYRLANTHGLRVIAVDWDLEAPGLHRYFGISDELAAKTSGILDYFLAWGAAVKRGDPEPPPEERDVTSWILPIEDEAHKPRFGSLSVLLAGRQDKTYDQRLARFDWREFYANEAGAAAVEALRAKLIERADVVLVDSRTGLTDAGGVCAIQIPDGVVLLTAPNEQSLEGTKEIARRISSASTDERAQRPKAKVWLAVSRTPSNEESYLAQLWFNNHADWFQEGIADGLWLTEDHADGIRSLEIPHVGRWGFGETVLLSRTDVPPADPLARAYEHLTEMLLRWTRGEAVILEPRFRVGALAPPPPPRDIASLEESTREAERRADILGLGIALTSLAQALQTAGRTSEAIRRLEQAIGIFLSRGARPLHMQALGLLAANLMLEQRWDEGKRTLTHARELAQQLGDLNSESLVLEGLAWISSQQHANEEAVRLLDQAHVIKRRLDPSTTRPTSLLGITVLYRAGRKSEALNLLREEMSKSRQRQDPEAERAAIGTLLELTAGDPLPDADALRARLAELSAPKPA